MRWANGIETGYRVNLSQKQDGYYNTGSETERKMKNKTTVARVSRGGCTILKNTSDIGHDKAMWNP